MARFAGWPRPPGGIAGSPHLFETWEALCDARETTDAGIVAWAAAVDGSWLRGPLAWTNSVGERQVRPAWVTVTHFFNHQTHHRGQAHCLITQAGVKTADTDLPWVVDLDALGIAPA